MKSVISDEQLVFKQRWTSGRGEDGSRNTRNPTFYFCQYEWCPRISFNIQIYRCTLRNRTLFSLKTNYAAEKAVNIFESKQKILNCHI